MPDQPHLHGTTYLLTTVDIDLGMLWHRIKKELRKSQNLALAWRRGAVDIASASGTRWPGFESRQGKHSSAALLMTYNALFVC
jgi:hypothetical protein